MVGSAFERRAGARSIPTFFRPGVRERMDDDAVGVCGEWGSGGERSGDLVQDVADGCVPCRPVLRAWLRGAITEAPVVLQARPATETAFTRAWRNGAKP